jgi:hypothetical protein
MERGARKEPKYPISQVQNAKWILEKKTNYFLLVLRICKDPGHHGENKSPKIPYHLPKEMESTMELFTSFPLMVAAVVIVPFAIAIYNVYFK